MSKLARLKQIVVAFAAGIFVATLAALLSYWGLMRIALTFLPVEALLIPVVVWVPAVLMFLASLVLGVLAFLRVWQKLGPQPAGW